MAVVIFGCCGPVCRSTGLSGRYSVGTTGAEKLKHSICIRLRLLAAAVALYCGAYAGAYAGASPNRTAGPSKTQPISAAEAKEIALAVCAQQGVRADEFGDVAVDPGPITLEQFLARYPKPAFKNNDRISGTLSARPFWLVILSRPLVEKEGGDGGYVVAGGGEKWVFVDAISGRVLHSFTMK